MHSKFILSLALAALALLFVSVDAVAGTGMVATCSPIPRAY